MNNPTLSLLQASKPANYLGTAQQALSLAPKMISMPKEPSSNAIEPPSDFIREYQSTVADDIVRTNAVQDKYVPGNDTLNYIAGYETPGSKDPYSAVNTSTGAFGRYQFIPKYAKPYADKLGVTVDDLKANPNLQDKAAALKLNDLKRELSSYNIPLTKQNMYLGWQQGAKGLSNLLQGKANYNALDLNLPKGIDRTAPAFLNYWYDRL